MKTILSRLAPSILAILLLIVPNAQAVLPLTLGQTNSGSLTLPGQIDKFTFTGTAGQRLFYDTLTVAPQDKGVRLSTPSGSTVWDMNQTSDSEAFYLQETGTYTLTVYGYSGATGEYAFRVLDLSTATPITLGTPYSSNLSPGSLAAVLRFTGTAGQRVNLDSISASSSEASWSLVSPANQSLTQSTITSDLGEQVLPLSGTYLVLIQGYSQNPAPLSYQVRVDLLSGPTGTPSGFGIVRSGSIAASEVKTFAYTAPAGLWVYFDSLSSGSPVTLEFLAPSGATAFSSSYDYDTGPFVLPESGAYTAKVTGTGDGAFSFRILNLAADSTALSFGTVYTPDLTPAMSRKIYRFSGTPGQRVYYDGLHAEWNQVTVEMFDPGASMVLSSTYANTDAGPISLKTPGTYYLVISSQTSEPAIGCAFRMLDIAQAPATPLSFNTTLSRLFGWGTAADIYRFSGSTGDRVFFDSLDLQNEGHWTLVQPDNTAVSGSYLAYDFEAVLTQTGTHLLIAGNAPATNSSPYSIRVVSAAGVSQPLAFGTVVTGSLTSLAQEVRYTFSGTAGQRLYYDALQSDYEPINVVLESPAGLQTSINGNSDADVGPFTLTESGTYRLLVKGSLDTVGTYSFRLLDLAQAPVTSIALDSPVTGTAQPGHQANIYRLTATAGQRLFFDASPANGSGYWTLVDPQNQHMVSQGLTSDFEIVPAMTGDYFLICGNSGQDDESAYAFTVVTPNTTSAALAFGATISGTLDEPGEEDYFSFAGSAGQRVYYDALLSENQNVSVRMAGPGDQVLFSANTGVDNGFFTLPVAGTYTVLQKATGDSLGTYKFRLIDAAQAPAVNIAFDSTVSSSASPGVSANVYRFLGTAGQRLYFDADPANGNGQWRLFGPANQSLGDTALTTDFEVVLPQTGTNLLVVGNSYEEANSPYVIRIVTPNTTTLPLTFGSTVSGVLAEAGEEDRFTFTGAAGQRLFYDGLDHDYDLVYARFIAPSGTVLPLNPNSDDDFGIFTLVENGQYTLVLKANGDVLGDYQFRLLDLTSGTSIAYNTPVSGSLTPQTGALLYRFNGLAGQRVTVDSLSASSDNATWSLAGIGNSEYLSGNIQADLGEVTLPVDGLYAIVIRGNDNLPGSLTFQIQVSLISSSSGGSSGFAVVHTGATTSGQVDQFAYSAPAGTPVYVDILDFSQPYTVEMIAPSGATAFSIGASDAGPYFLPESGAYTLKVIGYSDGTYNVRLLNLAEDSTELSFGTEYTDTHSPAYSARVFRFTGAPGQRLYYDGLGDSSEQMDARLFTPAGTLVDVVSGHANYDYGSFILPQGGTYYLVIDSRSSYDTTQSKFRLLDAYQNSLASPTPGEPVTGNIDPGTQAILYQVVGVAGQRLYFDANNENAAYDRQWELEGPDGELLAAQWLNTDFEVVLPRTGTNVLVIYRSAFDGTPSTYGFTVFVATNSGSNLTLGTPVSGSLGVPGAEAQWTFSGTAGQRLLYDALDADSDDLQAFLIDPSGSQIMQVNAERDFGLITLVNTGTYKLLFKGNQSAIGSYHARIIDVTQAPAQPITVGAPVTATLDPGTSAHVYRFTGAVGQRLFFDGSSLNYGCPAYWNLFSPNGQNQAGACLNNDFEQTLSQAGTHVLVISKDDTVTDSVPYQVRIVPSTSTTNTLVVNAVTSGNLLEPGNIAQWTFNGEAGQRIYFDSLDPNATSVMGTLTDPSGAVIHNNWASQDAGPLTLTMSGLYTLMFKPSGDATGAYKFRLLDLAGATTIPGDATVNAQVTQAFGASFYRLPGVPGMQWFTRWVSEYAPSSYLNVYGPANQLLNGSYVGSPFWDFATQFSENYFLVMTSGADTPTNYTFEIIAGNHAPVFTPVSSLAVDEMTAFSHTPSVTDPEVPGDVLSFTLLQGPPGMTVNPSSGVTTWNPTEADGAGTYMVGIRVTDDGIPMLSATNTFSLTVNEVNRAPTLTVPANQTINEQTLLSISASAIDPDLPPNSLTFSLTSPPAGMTINPTSGAIQWTPAENQGPGTHVITVVVTDNNPTANNQKQMTDTKTFSVTVNEVNVAPVLPAQLDRTINELTELRVTNTATDADLPANTLTYSMLNAPQGVDLSTNGVITWTPTEAQGPGTYLFRMRVVDNGVPALAKTNEFNVTVNEVNVVPLLPTQLDRTINELTELRVTNTATDADLPANTLTYSMLNAPQGVGLSTNGIITWTPTEAQGPGTYLFRMRVVDNGVPALAKTNEFNVTVNEVNVVPLLPAQLDRTINELTELRVTNTATDADLPSNTLIYSFLQSPPGAQLSASGVITWTPSEAQGPSTNVFRTKVIDNGSPAFAATNQFTVIVNEVNLAPVLGALVSRTVNPGQQISFTASVTDSDLPANTLTFNLVNPPQGASINPVSGAFSWRVPVALANTTNTIQVRVQDNGAPVGSDTESFTVTINPLAPVLISAPSYVSGQFSMTISGTPEPDYIIQVSTNLVNWSDHKTNVDHVTPFTFTDSAAGAAVQRNYRVRLAP